MKFSPKLRCGEEVDFVKTVALPASEVADSSVLLQSAKQLRHRAETLLSGNITAEDAAETQMLLEKKIATPSLLVIGQALNRAETKERRNQAVQEGELANLAMPDV